MLRGRRCMIDACPTNLCIKVYDKIPDATIQKMTLTIHRHVVWLCKTTRCRSMHN